MVKCDKFMGVRQLLGARAGLPPIRLKSTPMRDVHSNGLAVVNNDVKDLARSVH